MPNKKSPINLDAETEFVYIRSTHSEAWDEQIAKYVGDALVLYEDVSTQEARTHMQNYFNKLAADKKEAEAYLRTCSNDPEWLKIMPHIAALSSVVDGRSAMYVPVDLAVVAGQTLDDVAFKEITLSDNPLGDLTPELRSVYGVIVGALVAINERDRLTISQIEDARHQYKPSKIVLLQGLNHRAGSLYFRQHPQLRYKEVLLPEVARPALDLQQRFYSDYDRYHRLHARAFKLAMIKLILDGNLNIAAARDARKDWGAMDTARRQAIQAMNDNYWQSVERVSKLSGKPLEEEYQRAVTAFGRLLE